MKVTVHISGLRESRAAVGAAVDARLRALRVEVQRSLRAVERGAKRRAAVDTGDHRGKIHVRETGPYSGEVVAPDYAYLEFGSAPHYAPIEPLKAWARRHGMDEGVAYAIREAIARRGTPERPALFPAFEEERPRFVERVRAVMHAPEQVDAQAGGRPAGGTP